MAGILSGAMYGGGQALANIGEQGFRLAGQHMLQQRAAEIQEARDARLAEIRRGDLEFAEELRRRPGKLAQEEIEAKRAEFIDDPSGAMRRRNVGEMAEVRQAAYGRQGMVAEEMQAEGLEQQRQRDIEAKLDRAEGRQLQREGMGLQREQFAEQVRHAKVAEEALLGQLAEAKASGTLERAIKQLALNNANRVAALREEWKKATDQKVRAEIKEELDILTGKDTDKFLPYPVGYDPDTGRANQFILINTKTGASIDLGSRQQGGKPGERPAIESFFGRGAQRPKPSAGGGDATAEEAPAAAPPVAAVAQPAKPVYAQFIEARRGGFYINAPARSPAARLNGKSYATREAAEQAIAQLEAYR